MASFNNYSQLDNPASTEQVTFNNTWNGVNWGGDVLQQTLDGPLEPNQDLDQEHNIRSLEVLLVERSEQDERFYQNQESSFTRDMFNNLYNELKNNLDKLEIDEQAFSSLDGDEKNKITKECNDITAELDGNLVKFKNQMVMLWNEATETKEKYTEAWQKLKAFNDCSLETINSLSILHDTPASNKEDTTKVDQWFKESHEKLKNHWNIESLKKRYETASYKINLLKNIVKEVSDLKSHPQCPICWNGGVDTFNMPCGHTQCRKCSKGRSGSDLTTCPICRQSVTAVKTLYFS